MICAGCGDEVEGESGTIWCDTPLGMTTLRVHRTQECGRAALLARPDWKMRKDNQPPLTRQERLKRGMAETQADD